MQTKSGHIVNIIHKESIDSLFEILCKNRNIDPLGSKSFFYPSLDGLYDPFLLPDMDKAVKRILVAQEMGERIVIFGDYDVDGVSSTAILVRFLSEIGCQVSYRLPHRVHDGYGLKEYFFTELAEKNVKLVITVDCGTRDVGPIKYAHSLGIDVIITDHHAVPDTIPTEVVALINPKRADSKYPFQSLAGAGVAFKLLHAIAMRQRNQNNKSLESTLTEYVDLASLGTVADCMPILGENRTITSLGLKQMSQSKSLGLKKFLEGSTNIEGNADIIGFQIGPRINAAGRMDTPLTALRWLLASDERGDSFFEELEHLNETRKGTTEHHFEKALAKIDTTKPIIIYDADDLEHGIIGLVAGKLVEMYGKPAIVIKNGHTHPLTRRKGDEVAILNDQRINPATMSIASCRSPEWCNLIELLDGCKDLFIRYGGHRQAAGFTIETGKVSALRETLSIEFSKMHDIENIPKRVLDVECILNPDQDFTLENIATIDRFRPFGIGNRKPLFLLKEETIFECKPLGKEGKHLEIRLASNTRVKLVAWGWGDLGDVKTRTENGEITNSPIFSPGDIVSLIVELDKNVWNGKESITVVIKDIVRE